MNDCPWCGYTFRQGDRPLRDHASGRCFCNRDCYELDRQYPPTPPPTEDLPDQCPKNCPS